MITITNQSKLKANVITRSKTRKIFNIIDHAFFVSKIKSKTCSVESDLYLVGLDTCWKKTGLEKCSKIVLNYGCS